MDISTTPSSARSSFFHRRSSSPSTSFSRRPRYTRPDTPPNASAARVSFSHSDLMGSEDGEGEEDEQEEWEGDTTRSEFLSGSAGSARMSRAGGRKKADEPMKPITVVLYVVFFYVIWQILTRSTETEILSHLAKGSPHLYHADSMLPESSGSGTNAGVRNHAAMAYHASPYGFPHIPSPLPPSSSGTESPSTTRWILGIAFYPFYLVLMLLAVPLPFAMSALTLIIDILSTLLLPFTFTGKLLGSAFIVAPYTWGRALLRAFYPIYVFVGGMIGVGCVMGLGAGWAGRKVLDLLTGRSKREKSGSRVRRKTGNPSSARSKPGSGSGLGSSRTHSHTGNRSHGLSNPDRSTHDRDRGLHADLHTPSRTTIRRRSQPDPHHQRSLGKVSVSVPTPRRTSYKTDSDSSSSSTESLPPPPRTPAASTYRRLPDVMAQSLYPDDSVSLRLRGQEKDKGDSRGWRRESEYEVARATGREGAGVVSGTRTRQRRRTGD